MPIRTFQFLVIDALLGRLVQVVLQRDVLDLDVVVRLTLKIPKPEHGETTTTMHIYLF